jgi:hypothetical protein
LRQFLKQLAPPWTKPQRGNFLLLAQTFLQRRSLPIRRLARTLTGPTCSCRKLDRRLRRFLGSDHLDQPATLKAYLAFLLPRFGPVALVPVVLDWTFVEGYAILWAQLPYRGRSFPLLVAIYPVAKLDPEETFQTEAEMKLLKTLETCWPTWAPPPLLLADRGFDKGPSLDWLVARRWLFLVRGKRQPLCLDAQGKRVPATRLTEPGELLLFPHIRYYGEYLLRLHLVVSGAWDPKMGQPVEWRLVTNLPQAVLPRAARWYRDRWVFFGWEAHSSGEPRRVTLAKASQIRIRRHIKVCGNLNAYAPEWADYLARRRSQRSAREYPALPESSAWEAAQQGERLSYLDS